MRPSARQARGALGVFATFALLGCPPPPPAPPAPPPGRAPEADAHAPAPEADRPAPEEVDGPDDAGEPPVAPPVGLSPEAAASAVDVAPGEYVERLERGGVARPSANAAVGLAQHLELGGRARAVLALGDGALSYEVFLAEGDRLRLGAAEGRVRSLEPGGALELEWARTFRDPTAEAPITRALDRELEAGPLRLEALGLYRLPDGRVLGVGNVVEDPDGPGSPPAVSLNVFPGDYERDPMQGYDRHVLARPGATLQGERASLRVVRVEPPTDRGSAWGWVELEALP